jgi:hypothetical protein
LERVEAGENGENGEIMKKRKLVGSSIRVNTRIWRGSRPLGAKVLEPSAPYV